MLEPIIILPKNIIRYDTNLVKTNKIDCVNIEETVSSKNIELVLEVDFPLSNFVDPRKRYEYIFTKNEELYETNLSTYGSSEGGIPKKLSFKTKIDFADTFLKDLKVIVEIAKGLVDYDDVINNRFVYPNVSKYVENNVSLGKEFILGDTSLILILNNYAGFKKELYCNINSFSLETTVGSKNYIFKAVEYIKIKFYARRNQRIIKSYCLDANGNCVLTSQVLNFKPQHPYTYPSNELFQEGAVGINKYNNNAIEPLSKCIAHSILYQFKNGKQTATMTVNCLDYYDINGNKVIDEGMDRKTLKAGDIVIPYIKPDVPLARKKDGTPKKFCITSAEFEYSGRPLMNLIMEEVIE